MDAVDKMKPKRPPPMTNLEAINSVETGGFNLQLDDEVS